MPDRIEKLIDKLKSDYPELQEEPLLDDIEEAAYEDLPEEMPKDEEMAELPEEEIPPEEDEAPPEEEDLEEEIPPEEDEEDFFNAGIPGTMPKKRKKKRA